MQNPKPTQIEWMCERTNELLEKCAHSTDRVHLATASVFFRTRTVGSNTEHSRTFSFRWRCVHHKKDHMLILKCSDDRALEEWRVEQENEINKTTHTHTLIHASNRHEQWTPYSKPTQPHYIKSCHSMQFYWFVIFWHLLFATHIHFTPYVWCSIAYSWSFAVKKKIGCFDAHTALGIPYCQLLCAICTTYISKHLKWPKTKSPSYPLL